MIKEFEVLSEKEVEAILNSRILTSEVKSIKNGTIDFMKNNKVVGYTFLTKNTSGEDIGLVDSISGKPMHFESEKDCKLVAKHLRKLINER